MSQDEAIEPLMDTDEYTIWPPAANGYSKYRLKGIAGDHYHHNEGDTQKTEAYVKDTLKKRRCAGVDINTSDLGKLPSSMPANYSQGTLFSANIKIVERFSNGGFSREVGLF